MKTKLILVLLGVALFLSLLFGYWFIYGNTVKETKRFYFSEDITYAQLKDSLSKYQVLSRPWRFDLVAKWRKLSTIPKGSYLVRKGKGSFDLISKFKHGFQDPVRYTLSTATFVEDIARKSSEKLAYDSSEFMHYIMSDTVLSLYGMNRDNVMSLFIPNTYEFYWTVPVSKFIEKMHSENETFWNSSRKSKAEKLNLSPTEIYILASIVQKEYSRKDERSKIASVLLNRLRRGIHLEVDATAKYATRDFQAKRVTYQHTRFVSPYNTYMQPGLPPGPICVPEISTIDAVLEPEKTDYIFYCADPSLNGYHIFSKTLSEHNAVAEKYHSKMNELKIK